MAKWVEIETSGDGQRHGERAAADLATLVAESLPEAGRAVLAVSGGLDSMSLLDLAAGVRQQRGCLVTVATFDHASGEHTARATALVAHVALEYGLQVVVGRADAEARPGEAAWRAARWRFLRSVAREISGPVITAHTRDDQVETVLMRAMRGAGARGLAGLRAPSAVRRPLLDVCRADLQAYADARALRWIEDPTNLSRRFLRNRVRQDLLLALTRVQPRIADELIAVGDRAARWREQLAQLVDTTIRFTLQPDDGNRPALDIAYEDVANLTDRELGIVWPELASRAGVTLDRRGTSRAMEFTRNCQAGGRIQLSGGWELIRARESLELRGRENGPVEGEKGVRLEGAVRWGRWRFSTIEEPAGADPWRAELAGNDLGIRAWHPGDRMTVRHADQLVGRKVKYFLSDAKISGHIRPRWPVVLAGDEIVWIPGVRRSDAGTARSGRPVVTYVCDYLDRRP